MKDDNGRENSVGALASPRLSDAVAVWRTLHSVPGYSEDASLLALSAPPASTSDAEAASPAETAYLLSILAQQPAGLTAQRTAMVERIRHNFLDSGAAIDRRNLERVLAAITAVLREEFISADVPEFAYLPTAIKIGLDQVISHPHLVAVMTMAAEIRTDAHVLDIGTGSGYQAAILSLLAQSVISLEIVAPLADVARQRLKRLGYNNVMVEVRDGFIGAIDRAPYQLDRAPLKNS